LSPAGNHTGQALVEHRLCVGKKIPSIIQKVLGCPVDKQTSDRSAEHKGYKKRMQQQQKMRQPEKRFVNVAGADQSVLNFKNRVLLFMD